MPVLQAAGHDAVAVDLPGDDPQAGLPDYAEIARTAIGDRRDIIMVAMSLGGFTAPLVAAKAPVTGIVFVNAMIPLPGETPGAWWDNTGQPAARVAAAELGGYATEFDLEMYFLHDVPAEVTADGEAHQRPEADAVFESVCDFDSWPPVSIRVVAGADDRFFPVGFQQRVARERLGLEADVLPGGHLIALSQPETLARYLLAG
jgi:pimeloyl-ACP methyl ester carboxylesterase